MHGPTLAMLNDNSSFPRSHSSSNIPDLVNVDYKQPAVQVDDELPRAASFSNLSILQKPFRLEKEQRRVSTELAAGSPGSPQTAKGKDGKTGNRLSKEERPKLERVGRRKSLVARPKSWIARVKGGSPERQDGGDSGNTTPSDAPPVPPISKEAIQDSKTRTVSESFATFARRSWITSSRSPSPNRIKEKHTGEDGQRVSSSSNMTGSPITPSSRPAVPPAKLDNSSPPKTTDSPPKGLLRAPTTIQKLRQRPQSVLMNFTTFHSNNSSTSSLQRSSMDNRSTPRTSMDKVPNFPKTSSTEKLGAPEIPRRRDELWSAFRSLENDFSKFQAKSWSLKTNVVRSSVLPFFRNHASHPSNKTLRPEDLDRRITILHKWWSGLLEVLDGRQNQTVSGVDRPILLEACYAIMTRPEWRMGPSHYVPLSERSASSQNSSPERRPAKRPKSSSSLKSSASQFLIESVYHNARNLFIQNLLSQMAFVVNKMSMRHAPASLVTFCGKATAYAFFFVPGVAEALVRTWKIQPDILRRVSDELGLSRRGNKLEPDEMIAPFPAHIHNLGWISVKSTTNQLRQVPDLPILVAKIPWYGPWISRWSGRDSDLFFVFVKHYHILAEEFLLGELSLAEKARSPGYVLVQAQVLSVLEATVRRQPAADALPVTFDDVLAGADASAAALPLPSNNSARLMAENRLILLLRDFISERPSDSPIARLTFAETFGKIMQAAARRTSLFDHTACFTLCDFMEEALTIFVRFHHAHSLESDFIDWYFWLDVCKKMLESENSMTEIRLFAFLYGAWAVICNNEYRKEVMCLEWLLTEETFDKFFNHWCPMVRAYYMRLLCWRLCRDDGDASDLDTKIFCTVSARVKGNWAHYQYLKQQADRARVLPPSTAPCHPAPGRRLLIIRNDNHTPTGSLFLGFDGIVANSTTPTTQSTAYKRHSSLKIDTAAVEITTPKLTADTPSPSSTPNKKRWTFMNRVLPSPFSSNTSDALTTQPRTTSPTKTLEEARRETALARSRPALDSKSSSSEKTPPASSSTTHRTFSFKFSLEGAQHFEKPSASTNNHSRSSSERRIRPPRLPAPAQTWIASKVPGTSTEVGARDPNLGYGGAERGKRAKYAGRALAEWALIVGECNSFVERRRAEGVPGLRWVEVPTLGVEGFRRF